MFLLSYTGPADVDRVRRDVAERQGLPRVGRGARLVHRARARLHRSLGTEFGVVFQII